MNLLLLIGKWFIVGLMIGAIIAIIIFTIWQFTDKNLPDIK